jgi:hypothetical protein
MPSNSLLEKEQNYFENLSKAPAIQPPQSCCCFDKWCLHLGGILLVFDVRDAKACFEMVGCRAKLFVQYPYMCLFPLGGSSPFPMQTIKVAKSSSALISP